jgi:4-amino-4-deoxychorismate lyase
MALMDSKLDDNTLEIINSPQFEVITTLLYSAGLQGDSTSTKEANKHPLNNCYLLQHGLDRLRSAAIDFSFPAIVADIDRPKLLESLAIDIEQRILEEHPTDGKDPEKNFIVRLAYRKNGEINIMTGSRARIPSIQRYPTMLPDPTTIDLDVPIVSLYLDTNHIESSLFTKHKTTYREHYSAARTRVGLTPTTPFFQGEVLLGNEQGEVIGGGFTTVYFWRKGSWVTPAESCGAKIGVSRRWALENTGVSEDIIPVKDVIEGEYVWLSSAVGGFCRGKVHLTTM